MERVLHKTSRTQKQRENQMDYTIEEMKKTKEQHTERTSGN